MSFHLTNPNGRGRFVCVLALLLAGPIAAGWGADIILKKSFINTYKDRVTIDLDEFYVIKAHARPNRAASDADLHVAGVSDQVGLVMVAEIMNAALHENAVDRIHELEADKRPTKLSGVWRLWCEHPKAGETYEQGKQGKKTDKYKNANPHHVFEVHPITRLGSIDLLPSLMPIAGYPDPLEPGRNERVFASYRDKACEITADKATVTLTTTKADFNYIAFTMKLEEPPGALADGTRVKATILDLDGSEDTPLAEGIRMLFVRGSDAEQTVKTLTTDAPCPFSGYHGYR